MKDVVSAPEPELSAQSGGTASPLLEGFGRRGVKEGLQVFVAQAIDSELAPADDLQREAVRGAKGWSARTRLPFQVTGFSTPLISSRKVVVSSTLANALRYRSLAFCETSARRCKSAMPAHLKPGQRALWVALRVAVDLEVLRLFHRQFGAQQTAEPDVGVVVHFNGVVLVAMLDAHPFLPLLQIAGDLCCRLPRQLAVGVELLAFKRRWYCQRQE